ncbi:hypothetical protein PEX1_060350 [Penicillium expansum]|uniref:Uncharacterized protein n=1 Tax=Penicillium expansum TaxID=27334 RepID=A0A0A2JKX1_PENEN|nr:hypothetical protein PEX2_049690 [Penicillium expansum]KGO48583.1 hypothetical protein PEXP_073130 [Penicillium expansum]KGO55481.1 hypothetical protein PEX2_049690 [Penicillium expansum]KGO72331.1 hypothetical protein PEX1_060350 [Penicillium expansum]
MAENRQIEAPTDSQLEELTLLRVRLSQRAQARALLVLEAQQLLDCDNFLTTLNQYVLPPPLLEYVQEILEQRWALLLDVLEQVRLQEEQDQAMLGMWED